MSANASSGNPVQDTSLNRKDLGSASSISNASNSVKKSLDSNDHITGVIENQEHLQLTTEEAFFLSFGLGVLNVQNPITCETFSLDLLFSLFRQASYFPPRTPENVVPDDPFLLSYVVYHHFRSVGWVVRPGVKFAVDYLLYNRGPVFSHAEFAVIILPSYSQPYWHETKERKCEVGKREKKNWWWLHCVNRVQAQVRKSLVLAYVEIPPPAKPLLRNPPRPSSTGSPLADRFISLLYPSPKSFATSAALPVAGEGSGCGEGTTKQGDLDVRSFLKRYKVREITLKRWIPNRSRD
ncbi:hypothetical protein MMC20_001150 [Loxospora ochrophaea]|nr:hypothetical protein [Loxospora ochrophaea]